MAIRVFLSGSAALPVIASCLIFVGCGQDTAVQSDGCSVDNDCKGDRICSAEGRCVDPNDMSGGDGGNGSGGMSSIRPCGPPDGSAPPNASTGPDTAPPVVTCIGFDRTAYSAGETGYLEYRATDDVSGIASSELLCWSIDSETGNSDISVCNSVEPLGGDLYRIGFEVGDFVETGAFFLAEAFVHDAADNRLTLRASFSDETYADTNISVAHTTIGGTTTDVTPPLVSDIGFASSSYPAGGSGYVQYTAIDDLSGIAGSENLCWRIENASQTSSISVCGSVESLGNDRYQIGFDIDDFVSTGAYYLTRAFIHDEAGNETALSADPSDATFDGTSLAVPMVMIQSL